MVIKVKAVPVHYVDNKLFQEAMVEYKKTIVAAQEKGLTKKHPDWPPVTNYIGECFLKIAKHLAYRANFLNYSFRDEMISDGIENCLLYASNYDSDKYKNPFAYFTQIIFFAFVRRIAKEKKQLMTKYKLIESMDLSELVSQGQDAGEFENQFIAYLKEQLDKVEEEKRKSPKDKKPNKANTTRAPKSKGNKVKKVKK